MTNGNNAGEPVQSVCLNVCSFQQGNTAVDGGPVVSDESV